MPEYWPEVVASGEDMDMIDAIIDPCGLFSRMRGATLPAWHSWASCGQKNGCVQAFDLAQMRLPPSCKWGIQ